MKFQSRYMAAAFLLAAAAPALPHSPSRLAPASAVTLRKAPRQETAPLRAFLSIDPASLDMEALESLGVSLTMLSEDMATARIPLEALAQLSEVEGIRYVQVSSAVAPQLDKAIPEVGADDVRAGKGLQQGYNGKGVVIGIVDAGFDYTHTAFRDNDGNLRIKRVWEQTTKPSGELSSPEKFGYGVELTTPEQIRNAEGDIRNNTHGTHVAGIAAGSDNAYEGLLRGAAPEAELVLVSMDSGSDGNVAVAEGVAYIFDYADEVGKPCVVNLSLGTHAGPHDGTSSFDRLIDSMQGPGRLIVGSAGNDRQSTFHATHTFQSADEEPLRTCIDYRKTINSVNVGGNLEVWGAPGQQMEVALLVVNTRNGNIDQRVVVFPSEEVSETISLGRNVTGNFTVASESENPLNGKPHVFMTSGVTALRTNYIIAVEVTPKSAGQVDIWADNVYLGVTANNLEGYTGANGSTIAELGGTSNRILTIGAYTTRNEYTLYGETLVNTLDETVGAISSFSNYGPTADGRLKPQVAAPGCFIISAVSINGTAGIPISHSYETDGRWITYGYMQGTSMSSPLVAGVVATWLEAFPEMTPEQLAEIIRTTSRSDSFTGDLSEGNYDWGWGKIDAMAGLKETLRLAEEGGVSSVNPSQNRIELRGDLLHVLFGREASRASVSICNTTGVEVMRRNISSVTPGSDLTTDLSSLTPGIYLVTVATPNSTETLKIRR